MASDPKAVAAAQARLRKKKVVAQRVLATEDGKAFFEALKNEFFTGPATLKGATPEEMAFNLGRCDVLAYIEQLNKNTEEN